MEMFMVVLIRRLFMVESVTNIGSNVVADKTLKQADIIIDWYSLWWRRS